MSMPSIPWYLQENIVESYESWYEGKGKRADLLEKALLSELLDYVGKVNTVLEVGVGTAHFTRYFESFRIQCVGLDFSPLMLKQAKRLWNGPLVRGDAHHLPFRGQTFDLVTYITCMEYMHDPVQVLQEARRIARQGIVWGIMNKWSLPTMRRKIQVMLGRNPFYSNARFYSILDAKRVLRKALGKIDYTLKWSTTVYPRILLARKSQMPFGAFLGVAAKFASLGDPDAGAW
jgi:ubiquinone/menaquinone biosynthesis C-methylase UbiE